MHLNRKVICGGGGNKRDEATNPGSDLTLPKPALLSDFVGASKLLHVLAEVALGTVLSSSAGLTFPTHSD